MISANNLPFFDLFPVEIHCLDQEGLFRRGQIPSDEVADLLDDVVGGSTGASIFLAVEKNFFILVGEEFFDNTRPVVLIPAKQSKL